MWFLDYIIRNLQLVVRQNAIDRLTEKNLKHGNNIISGILIISNWSHTSATNIFSNCLFYCQCYLSFPAMLCLPHSLSFYLSAVLLSPNINCFDIKTLSCISTLAINKRILYKTVLISKVAPTWKKTSGVSILSICKHCWLSLFQWISNIKWYHTWNEPSVAF